MLAFSLRLIKCCWVAKSLEKLFYGTLRLVTLVAFIQAVNENQSNRHSNQYQLQQRVWFEEAQLAIKTRAKATIAATTKTATKQQQKNKNIKIIR